MPTRLEQQLIPTRFPTRMEQWLGAKLLAKLRKQQLQLQTMHLTDAAPQLQHQQLSGYVQFLPVVNVAPSASLESMG